MLTANGLLWTELGASACLMVVSGLVASLWTNRSRISTAGYSPAPALVFLIIFGAIGAILVAHAVAGKVLTTAGGVPLFAFLLPVAALAVAIVGLVLYVRRRADGQASGSWPSTPGTIIESRMVSESSTDSDGGDFTSYRPQIRFAYRVGNKEFVSARWKLGLGSLYSDPAGAQAQVERFAVGQKVEVYFDPRQPDRGTLERGSSDASMIPLVFSGAFGTTGVLFFWMLVSIH